MRWTTVLLIALAGGEAWAQEDQSVIVFPADGEAPAEFGDAAQTVTAVVAEGAELASFEVTVSAARRTDVAEHVGCEAAEPDCLRQIADTLGADVVVAIELTATDDGLDVGVQMVPRDGSAPTQRTWSIDAADRSELEATVREHAVILFGGDPQQLIVPPDTEPAVTGEIDEEVPPDMRGGSSGASSRRDDGGGSRLGRVKLYSWLTTGAGVALIATGSVFLVGAGNKQDEIDSAPEPQSLADFRAIQELEDEADSRALWGNVLTGAGIVVTGVGTYLIIKQLGSEPDRGGVAVAPAVFPDGLGVTFTVVGIP